MQDSLATEQDIRVKVGMYLDGRITLDKFREWFMPHAGLWAEQLTSARARELAYEIIGLLAEYDHEQWTEEQVRLRLIPLRQGAVVAATFDERMFKALSGQPVPTFGSLMSVIRDGQYFQQETGNPSLIHVVAYDNGQLGCSLFI
jgi:hypothetical protein